MEFRLPADALVPLPGSVAAPSRRPLAAPTSADPFDAFGSSPVTAAAARDDFADLEALGAIGAPKAQAVAGTLRPASFTTLLVTSCSCEYWYPQLAADTIIPADTIISCFPLFLLIPLVHVIPLLLIPLFIMHVSPFL